MGTAHVQSIRSVLLRFSNEFTASFANVPGASYRLGFVGSAHPTWTWVSWAVPTLSLKRFYRSRGGLRIFVYYNDFVPGGG